MKRHRTIANLMLLANFGVSVSACDEPDPEVTDPAVEERIIGGFPLRAAKYNAVGALGVPLGGGYDEGDLEASIGARPYIRSQVDIEQSDTHYPFCSGTLIGPNAVLTAEHCVDSLSGDEEFLIGFDGANPQRAVRIAGVVVETSITGGILSNGSDVAVAILEEPITDIAPMKYGLLGEDDIGDSVVAIGYGWRNNHAEGGLRYMGEMQLRGRGGNHALNVWDSLAQYIAEFPNISPDYGLGDDAEGALSFFDLLTDYEVSVGNSPGNAQACRGDSGGPIAKTVNGVFTVYGVGSAGVGTNELICDWGAVYATLGPAALEMVDAAVGCGLITVEGQCDGQVATRCAPPEEGGYEVVQTDCSVLGLMCGVDETGELGCIPDPCEGIPEAGTCEGDTAVRCSLPDEGPRRVLRSDCTLLGGTCGFDDGGEVSCLGVAGPSCNGNCGGSSEAPDGTSCFCDDGCAEYGDCCSDFEHWCVAAE